MLCVFHGSELLRQIARWFAQLKTHGQLRLESTNLGEEFIEALAGSESHKEQYFRATAVVKTFGGYSATKLMNFVYEAFPELNSMRWGDEIEL